MSRPELWLVMAGMGVITLALRTSFLLLQDRVELPRWLERALRFVPAAVLAAIVAPALVRGEAPALPGLPALDARLLAGLLAAAVAWRTKNMLATIGVGMAALWTLTWLLN